jgi:hypothetical protein
MPSPRALVAALGFCGYLALALSLGNFYPISTFEMYSSQRTTSASRIIVIDQRGAAREVRDFEAWSCDGALPIHPSACPNDWPYAYTTYLDREASEWLTRHPGEGGEPVEVVRRVFRLSSTPGPTPSHDCLLARCRATVRRR